MSESGVEVAASIIKAVMVLGAIVGLLMNALDAALEGPDS